MQGRNIFSAMRRTPQGVRGLKHHAGDGEEYLEECRTPQGVRGLKHHAGDGEEYLEESHSARSAWIETECHILPVLGYQSHSARSAWIETWMI